MVIFLELGFAVDSTASLINFGILKIDSEFDEYITDWAPKLRILFVLNKIANFFCASWPSDQYFPC